MRQSFSIVAVLLAGLLTGCGTVNKVAEVDPTSGQLKSERGTVTTAKVVTSKTVSLDVDGEVATIRTFAGSVDGLLQDQGVVVGERDVVPRRQPVPMS